MADYKTLERRPLLMVGTWNASTGTEAVTDEDLASIVAAAESGVLDNPIVKIGHVDPRFESYLEDGSPAYGQITNLTIEDGVLYGDYIHVPADLADSLDSAYPRSSVELARGVVLRDQTGAIVHEFQCVLTANALLGATPPAVKGLSTKMSAVAAKASGSPTYIEIRTAQFSLPGGNTARALNEKLAAAIQAQHSGDSTWAYLEDFTDEKVIFAVEGYGESTYYEQAYNVSGPHASPELVGTPVQVIKETKWVTEKSGDTGTVPQQPADSAHSLSEAPPENAPTPSDPTQGETPMPTVDKDKAADLRNKYGLPTNASYEDLLAKVLEDQEKTNSPQNVKPGTDETPNDEVREQQQDELNRNPNFAEGEGEHDDAVLTPDAGTPAPKADAPAGAAATQVKPADVPAPATAAPAEGAPVAENAVVSKSALAEFQSRFAELEAREHARLADETKARRDNLVTSWWRSGRLSDDDEAARVRQSMERPGGEEIAVELIGSRTPMFSTRELGHAEPSIFAHQAKDDLTKTLEADDALFSS